MPPHKARKRVDIAQHKENLNEDDYPSQVAFMNNIFTKSENSDVILRTSFHDFHLHKMILSRSSFFKTMFSEAWKSHEQMVDGKQLIDFVPLEGEIVDGKVNPEAFSEVLRYIYTDEIEVETVPCRFSTMHTNTDNTDEDFEPQQKKSKYEISQAGLFEYLIQLAPLAKYFDLKQLLQHVESKLQGIHKILFIDATRKIEDYDLLMFACSLQGYGRKSFKDVPLELMENICLREAFPFQAKIKIIKYHAKDNFGKNFTLLPTYKNVLTTIQQGLDNSLITGQCTEDLDGVDFKFPKDQVKEFKPCSVLISGGLECDTDYGSEFSLFHGIGLTIDCRERSSAYWWNFNTTYSLEDVDGYIFIQYEINDKTREEMYHISCGEFTIYAPQFHTAGSSFTLIAHIQPSKSPHQ